MRTAAAKGRMVKVLDESDILAKSNITKIVSEQDVGIPVSAGRG